MVINLFRNHFDIQYRFETFQGLINDLCIQKAGRCLDVKSTSFYDEFEFGKKY